MIAWRSRNVRELVELLAADVDELARAGMLGLGARPGLERIAAVHAARQRSGTPPASPSSSRVAMASSRSTGIEMPFVEPDLLLELVAPEPERRAGLRRELGFEVLDVGADRLRRFGLRVGQIAEQVQVVDARQRRAADRRR